MHRYIPSFILSVFILTACAGSQRATALNVVQASDVVADDLARGWSLYVDAMIEKCSADPATAATVETRRACMGRAGQGEKLETAVATLVAAQEATRAVIDGKPGDLAALLAKLTIAADAVRPYFQAMKGSN